MIRVRWASEPVPALLTIPILSLGG